MSFGFGWMIQVVPEVCAALDKQFANSPAETRSASEAAAIGSILGRYRIFMKLAEFVAWWPSWQLGWSRKHGGDVHSRASERNRG